MVCGICILWQRRRHGLNLQPIRRCHVIHGLDHTIAEMATEMGVPSTTAWAWLHKGLKLLLKLKSVYIRWPTLAECRVISAQFESYAGLRGIIGSVDCSHIAVRVRNHERVTYNCRKMFYSIHLMAVVDAADRFLHVNCGSSGSMSDGSVLRYSSFNQTQFMALQLGEPPIIPYGYCVIADGGFMALPWIVANYSSKQAEKPACAAFNVAVAATRHGVERAYGQLKARFKILGGRSSFNSVETVVDMNMAAVILHNANLDVEARHSHFVRGPAPVSGGAGVSGVARAQREYSAVLQHEVSGSGLTRVAWPERLTRVAGQSVRRAMAIDLLGTADTEFL